MTDTLERTPTVAPSRAARALAPALARRRFALAVGGVSAAVGAFLALRLTAWPPHEDETLALFVGRDSLPGVIEHVTRERGGAPLHFVLAWAVAHAGLGLEGLRAVSAAFAVASLPLVALLGARLAGRRAALLATALAGGSWALLFHGVYGRMYSLFLFTALLSWLALLAALDRGGGRRFAAWGAAILLCVATHPYGALVLAGQAAFVLLARRDRLRAAAVALAAVLVAGTPFWVADVVLAGRFDVGVGGGEGRLDGPGAVLDYLWRTAGDFTAGWWPVTAAALALAALGLASLGREAAALTAAAVVVPAAALLAARLGSHASPESRHLVFALPVLAVLVAAGLVRATRGAPALAPVAAALLVAAEVAWAWERTPGLFEREQPSRLEARARAGAYLASVVRPGDLLFGYEPLWLDAWERSDRFPRTVLPRADAALALRALRRERRPLGHGVWVLDAGDRTNRRPRARIEPRGPTPAAAFEARAFGPFLVVRSREPTRTPRGYLALAARVQLLGRSLGIGDADVNLRTVEGAERARRGYASSERSLSRSSR